MMTVMAKPVTTADRLVLRPSRSYLLGFLASTLVPFPVFAAIDAFFRVELLRFSVVPVVLQAGWGIFVARGKVVIDWEGVELERAGQRLVWSAIRRIEVAPAGRRGRKGQAYFVDRMGQRSALLTWGRDWRHWHWTPPEVRTQLDRISQWCGAHGITMPPITGVGA